jgi:calcium/calmodulin-dependent protein kinase I
MFLPLGPPHTFTDEYWSIVSDTARNFVSTCLTTDPEKRPTAAQMLEHEWLTSEIPHFVENETGEPRDLLPHVRKAFDAKKTCASHIPLL